jgi:F-type H+-transporting ATPase subunit delta
MADVNAARRYARALVELAREAGEAPAVEADLQRFHDLIAGEGVELGNVLRSPVFSADERKNLLNEVLPRVGVKPLTSNFLKLVSERGRMDLLQDIIQIYVEMMDEHAGRLRVQVSTVDPLTPQLETELKAAFEKSTGKTVLLDARIDPSLIGGMVAHVGDRVYDASIKSRLLDIKHSLINASAAPEAGTESP